METHHEINCIRIERPVYEDEHLRKKFQWSKTKTNYFSTYWKTCTDVSLKRRIVETIPVLGWLPQYDFRHSILSDIISGITVAIMHIPQGMAYGMLGNVPPVVGIYMAFFPVLIYFIFGTSRHNSMGTFAVVCLMTGKAVIEHSHPSFLQKGMEMNGTSANPEIESLQEYYSPIQIASAVTFTVAMFQLGMYFLRLGAISALLSDTLVSGFTTGAAFQVIASQLKDLFGLTFPKEKGYFVVIKTLRSIYGEISTLNYATVLISAVTITVSVLNNELLKPIVAKRSSFPVPMEFIAIVSGTLISKYMNLADVYGVAVVGEIPSGLPVASPPPFPLVKSVLLDGFSIAVVAYSVSLSMALIFAQKMDYEVDANQELLAQGLGNAFGSFFSCMPFTASLSRSSLQQSVGGKTQIASLVSCSILLVILLWMGPFFENLPKSVLAAVIIVALKGMIVQIGDLYKFWKLNKLDALVWLITFATAVFVSIDIGLLAGVVASLLVLLVMSFRPYTCLLGTVAHTDIYVDTSRYKEGIETPGVKIFHYCGGINFATRDLFKDELFRMVNINPQKELKYIRKLRKYSQILDEEFKEDVKSKMSKIQSKIKSQNLRFVILDFSAVSYVDPSGIKTINASVEIFNKLEIPIYIAAVSEPVYDAVAKYEKVGNKKRFLKFFPTIQDAMEFANGTSHPTENIHHLS